MKKIVFAVLMAAACICPSAQDMPDYDQARRFSGPRVEKMLFSTMVDPHWTPKGDAYWYAYTTSDGTSWWIVDGASASQKLLFDNDKLAAELTKTMKDPFDAQHLPIRDLRAMDDGKFTFYVESSQEAAEKPDDSGEKAKPGKDKKPRKEKEKYHFLYDPKTQTLTHLTDYEEPKYPEWASVSPDGNTVLYAKDLNLYKMSRSDYEKAKKDENDSTIVDIQLTSFGVPDFGFGMPRYILNTDTLLNGKRRGVRGVWSPDSRHFAVVLTDERNVGDLWVINAVASPRPTLESYKYHMPGEKNAPVEHLYLFNVSDNTYKEINTEAFKDQTLAVLSAPRRHSDRDRHEVASMWLGDNESFIVERTSRDLHRVDVCRYTIGQDSIVPIIEERMNTYIDTQPVALSSDGTQLVHWSERDGWAHLYLYDRDGNLKRRLTEGSWHVKNILKFDDKNKVVYFTATGKKPEGVKAVEGDSLWNPYYQHLYRVSLDGSDLRQLTVGNYFHSPTLSDNGAYFIDNYSCVNTVPSTQHITTTAGKATLLQRADFSQLFAAGYKFPEPFVVKAADGVTDLYGVMYKPFNFDPSKSYPIIDYVYPGPQVEATNYLFRPMSLRTDRLAQAGFIVITVGNRGGHPDRSKWYHTYGYGNLRDYGLADHKAAIEQLSDRRKYIDINKVGIHGHSGGGFMSTAAILQYPDFFKVAVSCAGNHDNSIYNRWWSEKHHGVKERITENGDTVFDYHIDTNAQIAGRLQGHLLLVHGDIDNNVHPGNTTRVVDALIKANKRFDMLYLPEQRHGFGNMNEYFYWRMVDYFSEHLLGEKESSIDIKGMKP